MNSNRKEILVTLPTDIIPKEIRQQNKVLFLLKESDCKNSNIFQCEICHCYINKTHQYNIFSELKISYDRNYKPTQCYFCDKESIVINRIKDFKLIPPTIIDRHSKKGIPDFTWFLRVITNIYQMFKSNIYIVSINNKSFLQIYPILSLMERKFMPDERFTIEIYNENDELCHRVVL